MSTVQQGASQSNSSLHSTTQEQTPLAQPITMVTVALAGATTGLGLTMLRVFLTQNTSHKIILLSRSEQPQLASQGVDVRPVDYSDHQSLVSALHGVHTVLSVIGGGAPGKQHPQIALLEAAKEAGVTRFAPSEYAGQGYEGIDLYQVNHAQSWSSTTFDTSKLTFHSRAKHSSGKPSRPAA